ncbi:hypothetical protein [Wukongibacter sp. M2B1]|uniref:hypothetical protein n=1 Tax=Wukongibacter sp. M2B1 TaxID=3088895 RepID=UPI003D794ABB
MKKKYLLFLILTIVLSVSGCGNKITYSENLPYLPLHKNMTLETFEEPKTEEELAKSIYAISGTSFDDFLNEYEEIFHEDGWETTLDNKPNMLTVQKKDHEATVIIYEKEGALKAEIMSK